MAQQGKNVNVTVTNISDAETLQKAIDDASHEDLRRFNEAIINSIAKHFGIPVEALCSDPGPTDRYAVECCKNKFNKHKNFGEPFRELARTFADFEYQSYLKKVSASLKEHGIQLLDQHQQEEPSQGDTIMQSIRSFCR